MNNTNLLLDFFKSGFYERYWGWQLNNDDSKTFAESSLKLLNATSGHILDWCGGWGRISIFYAEKGFEISLLDFNIHYLKKAKELFNKKKLDLKIIEADCRLTPLKIKADYATCFFNSVGFLDDKDQVKAFKSLFDSLKPNGKILIDCMNLLFLAKYIKPIYDTKRDDGYIFRQNNRFNFNDNFLYSSFEIINNTGCTLERKVFHQRLYTPMDIKNIIESAGFKKVKMYSDLNGNDVSFETPKIFLMAEK